MKTTFKTLLLFFLLLSLNLNAQIWNDIMGHSGDYFNKEQFKSALGQATTTVSHTSRIDLQSGTLKGHAGVEEVSTDANQGSWRVTLTSWRNLSGDEVDISYAPAIVMNYGNRFEYAFFSPDIPDKFFDKIVGELNSLKEDMADEYDDMTVEWGRHENKVTITAVYSYQGGVDEDDIDDRLVYLMNECRTMMYESAPLIADYKEDYHDELMDSKLRYLSKSDLLVVVGEWMSDFEEEHDGAKEGYFQYTNSETYHFEIYNYGSEYYFTQWINVPDYVQADNREEVLAKAQKYVADEGAPDHVNQAIVKWYPGYEGNALLIQAIYQFDGSISGEDFYESQLAVKEEFMKDIHSEIVDIFEDYE